MLLTLRQLTLGAMMMFITAGLGSAQADGEAVKEKLFQAKKEYDTEVQKFRKAVFDLFDKREDSARAAGDKKAVDLVKAERDAFNKDGVVPALLPMAVRQQVNTARMNLDKAYTAAVKDFIRMKEDAAAEAVEKEQQAFQLSATVAFGRRSYLVTLKHFDVRTNGALSTNGTSNGGKTKIKLNGELVPHSIHLHPPDNGFSTISYPLAGKYTVFRATVGVPKVQDDQGDPVSGLTFEVLGDGKSLWKSEPVTKTEAFQRCELRVEKVKTLTLRVNCPDKSNWAWAWWFEPTILE